MSGEQKHPPPPRSLGRAGRRLWRGVVSGYELRPDELFILETACSCADVVEKLAAAMEGQPLVVRGSMGQEREHPLLSEQRQQRALVVRTLAQLKLPDLDAGALSVREAARTKAARKAAHARWDAS